MSNPITDILWWINSEVDKLSATALPRMKSVMDAAQAELQADLARALVLGKDDKYTAQVHRNALVQIQGALDHLNTQTRPDVDQALRVGARTAAQMATAHLIREVQSFSSIFEGTIRPIALESASVIAEGTRSLMPRYRTSAARYAGEIGEDIRKQLAIGHLRGETIDQLTTRLGKLGGPKGLVYTRGMQGDPNARAEYIAEGLFKRYRSWGERLARTEVVNAYNECALIGMDDLEEEDPGYFKRWDAAIDGRLCPLCRMFDDLVVPIDGYFPLGFRAPPRHPNCRCACVIWRKEWDEADVRDNIMAEVKRGKHPGTIESVPHKIRVPEPDYKAEAGKRMSKGGKKPAGFPESPPASMTPPPAPTIARTRPRLSAEQRAEREALAQARAQRRAEREVRQASAAATRAMREDERRQAREARKMARLDAQADRREARARAASSRRNQAREAVEARERNARLLRSDMSQFRAEALGDKPGTYVPNEREIAYLSRRYQQTPEQITALAARINREHERFRRSQEAITRKAEKEARAAAKLALKNRQKTTAKDEVDHIEAVRKMALQPMAKTFHPSIEVAEDLKKYQLERMKTGNNVHRWFKDITLEEASHAFAAPEGFRGVIKTISEDGIQIEYFSLHEQTITDKRTGKTKTYPAGTKAAVLHRDFYSKTEIHHSLFVVEPHVRSDGFADQVNGQAMLRYEKWGLKKISVDAAWVGRYKWAKMGFEFENREKILSAGFHYIDTHVPAEKRADYKAKLRLLVNDSWKLASWDEGDQYPASFTLPERTTSSGEYPIGKAILLDQKMPMWSGAIHLGDDDHDHYKHALGVVQAGKRK